jgi:predicted Zn-dependent peptidase
MQKRNKVINKTILSNGVKIITKKIPHVRSVSMGVWVNVGARDETDDQSGLSHFIEHMIFKGTARRSAYEIAKAFDAIGGHTNAFTSMEHTCYYAKVLDTHLETMVEILSDIFLNSVFDAQEVERERPVIYQEIGMVEDSPEEYLHQVASRNFWGDHPLGRSILGTRKNIKNFKPKTIKAFFNQFYHPERILIAVAGNVDHDGIIDLVGPAFESIHNGHSLPERYRPRIKPADQSLHRDLEQAHICLSTLGLSVTDPQRFAFSLMNTILGGNMSSRLFQEIREQRGLAYSVYSFMASHVDTGMFGVYAGVTPEAVTQTIDLIVRDLKKIMTQPVSATELKDAKEYTKGNLCLATESVDNQMVRLAQNEIHFDKYIPLQSVMDNIEAVTVEEVQNLATELFKPEQASLTVLGPVDKNINLKKLISFLHP